MTRLEQIAQILAADEDYARELLSVSAEAAAAKLGEQGYDFTADELKAFAEKLAALSDTAERELDENALDDVTGGSALGRTLLYLAFKGISPLLPIRWR